MAVLIFFLEVEPTMIFWKGGAVCWGLRVRGKDYVDVEREKERER